MVVTQGAECKVGENKREGEEAKPKKEGVQLPQQKQVNLAKSRVYLHIILLTTYRETWKTKGRSTRIPAVER